MGALCFKTLPPGSLRGWNAKHGMQISSARAGRASQVVPLEGVMVFIDDLQTSRTLSLRISNLSPMRLWGQPVASLY